MSKHFYIGSQRIASQLCSSGSMGDITKNPTTTAKAAASTVNFGTKYADLASKVKARYDSLGVAYHGRDNGGVGFWAYSAPINETDQYYYHPDHLGSSSLITNLGGELVQHIEYVPFGEVFVEERTSTWGTPYKFTGKELDEETGMYYHGARYLNPRESIWLSVDPLAEKYPGVSSYVYCMNNPVRFIDPNGQEVFAMNKEAKQNLRNTLTKNEAKYLRFKKDGQLDTKRLNKSKSTSENMTALKAEANSEIKYRYMVTDKDHAGKSFSEEKGKMYRGVTEFPDAQENPSPNNDVWILTSKFASNKLQARNTAHEGYGHAHMYEITRDVIKSSHTYKNEGSSEWDDELKMRIPVTMKVPTNQPLENLIKNVEKEAIDNYESRY